MKTIWKTGTFECIAVATAAFLLSICADASPGDFYPAYEAKVIAHLALPGNPARRMFLQREGRRAYLYLRQASEQGLTVVDVTQPNRPEVVNHVPEENLTMVDPGLAISETLESPKGTNASPAGVGAISHVSNNSPELVRVMDVSDPAHPRTVQTFQGVTSIVRDDARNLIYVANGSGIWILSHHQVLRRHLCGSSDAISSAIPNCD